MMMLQSGGSRPSGGGRATPSGRGTASVLDSDDTGGAALPCIFSDVVPIRVRPLGRDVYISSLLVRLQPDSITHPRNLIVELTDESDLFFYHSLVLGEGDFHTLKSEQSLRVDFQAFPTQLMELFRRCMLSSGSLDASPAGASCGATPLEHDKTTSTAADSGAPRMFACLDCGAGGDGLLSIVESNPFRELTHIALRLKQGTDEAVKRHLAGKLRGLRASNAELNERLQSSEDSLSRARLQVDELTAHSRVATEERTHLEQSLVVTHQRELAELRESHALSLGDQLRTTASERARAEDILKTSNAEALARATSAERKVDELQHQLRAVELLGKQRQERLDASETQHCDAKQELKALRDQVKELELTKFQNEREIGEFRVKHSGLQEQLSSKDQLLKNHTALLDQHGSQKLTLDESYANCRQQLKSLEEKFALAVQEIHKGNQAIQFLRTESKQVKSKLKLKTATLAQLEKASLELEQKDALNKHVLEQKESEISREKVREGQQQLEVAEYKERLGKAHEVLKENQEVIQYLNRQLTERDAKSIPYLGSLGVGQGSPSKAAGTLGVDSARMAQLNDFMKNAGLGKGSYPSLTSSPLNFDTSMSGTMPSSFQSSYRNPLTAIQGTADASPVHTPDFKKPAAGSAAASLLARGSGTSPLPLTGPVAYRSPGSATIAGVPGVFAH